MWCLDGEGISEYMKDHIFEVHERHEDMFDHLSYTHNWSICEIRTQDLCDKGAVL